MYYYVYSSPELCVVSPLITTTSLFFTHGNLRGLSVGVMFPGYNVANGKAGIPIQAGGLQSLPYPLCYTAFQVS